MSIILGSSTLARLAIPTGIDAVELLKVQIRGNRTAEQAVRDASLAIGAMNQAIVDAYGGLFYITDGLYSYNRQGAGSRRRTPAKSEGVDPDPVRTDSIGNMLPYKEYIDEVAWTVDYLKRAPEQQLNGDLALIADSFWNEVGYQMWNRILTDNENIIGSSGYDVGWAIGDGTNVNYIPPQKPGFDPVTSSHTHFLHFDDTSKDWADVFEGQIKDLVHHGHNGMLTIYVSYTDLAEVEVVDGFVRLKRPELLVVGSGADNPNNPMYFAPGEIQGMPGEKIGEFRCSFGHAEIRWNEFIPTNYAWATRSYGVNHPNNPLAIRVDTDIYPGFGLMVLPTVTDHLEPKLKSITFEGGFGIGVNDRTGGVAAYLADGAAAWADADVTAA